MDTNLNLSTFALKKNSVIITSKEVSSSLDKLSKSSLSRQEKKQSSISIPFDNDLIVADSNIIKSLKSKLLQTSTNNQANIDYRKSLQKDIIKLLEQFHKITINTQQF
jgi:hypothetical protein